MSQQESVEYLIRQLDKVHKPKTAVKVVKAYTRELKRAKKAETRKAEIEQLGGIARELIRATGNTAAGALSSPAGAVILIGALMAFSPTFAAGFITFAGQAAKAVAQAWRDLQTEAVKDLPPENPAGLYCIRITTIAGVNTQKCWSTVADRDTAFDNLDTFGLYTKTKFDRTPEVGRTIYCVRAEGFLGARVNQCFDTVEARETFISDGLRLRRIANPERYETVVA